ncbi:MAG: hypothetical protein RIQ79_1945 [Verrucomicrobiota bacterium]
MNTQSTDRPRTGVLINNYNNGRWLRACVDSVIAQTHPADEIIVYDDGSTDDSLAILHSYGERITLLAGAHNFSRSGRASQRTGMIAAFAASTAEHLYLLDGDDAYTPTHLADYESAWAEKPEAVMVQGPMTRIDPAGVLLGPFYEARKHRRDYLADIYRHHETDYFYITSAFAFRRDFLALAFPIIERENGDYASDMQLALHATFCGPILTRPTPTSLYRVRVGSLVEIYGLRGGHRAYDTRDRALCFNRIAVRHGRPSIQIWRNFTYLQQVARLWLPNWLTLPLARLKVALRRPPR